MRTLFITAFKKTELSSDELSADMSSKNNMDWMKFRPVYFLVSALALGICIYSIIIWGFKLSIDFTGGTVIEYKLENSIQTDQIKTAAQKYEVKDMVVLGDRDIQLKFSPGFTQVDAQSLQNILSGATGGQVSLVRLESVGPTLSQEILRKTYIAVLLSSLVILFWVALQFKSVELGITAILAVIHDLIVLIGTFSLLGHFKGVELDILFVTAMLTIFSLSLYDTIVVYDRIRESSRRHVGARMYDIANKSVTETIVRSLNTSLSTALPLLALFLFGGASIKWFALALLIGVISGTYSSPFVAVPFLVTWHQIKDWRRKCGQKN